MAVTQLNMLSPESLVLLALVPLLAVVYLVLQRRKRKFTLRYSSLALIRPALARQPKLRRHIPPALFLLALASLMVTLARPTATVRSSTRLSTVMLVMDVSASMSYTDVLPNRLSAAESAAQSFVSAEDANTQIGIVVFSSHANLILPPTTNHARLDNAIHSLTLGSSTAIGSGILTALQAISNSKTEDQTSNLQDSLIALHSAGFAPEVIILMTDGVSNNGPSPVVAAQSAEQQGVRVYTIGFGTVDGPGGGKDFNGLGSFDPGLDEPTLKQVASMTGGTYHKAQSASELQKVFASLSTTVGKKVEVQEISVAFAALGALLAAAAMLLSFAWHPLP